MVALFVAITIVALLTMDYFVLRARQHRESFAPAAAVAVPVGGAVQAPCKVDTMPANIFLDPGSVWAQLRNSGDVRLGISCLVATAIGLPDSIEILKKAGEAVRRGDSIVILSRGGRRLTLKAPVDGQVERLNTDVLSQPARLLEDPYGAGWLFQLRPEKLGSSLRQMFLGEEARQWLLDQISKVRDFITSPAGAPAPVPATMLDGGALVDGFATHLDDDKWRVFVHEFFHAEAQDMANCSLCAGAE